MVAGSWGISSRGWRGLAWGGPESESPLQVLREADLAGGPMCVLHLNCCPPPPPLGTPTLHMCCAALQGLVPVLLQ